jgi:hypothetical protein
MLVAMGALILIGGLALWLVVAFGSRGGDATRAEALTDLQPSDGASSDGGAGSSNEPTSTVGGDDGATGASDGDADCGSTYDDGSCDVGGGDSGGGGDGGGGGGD